MSLVTRPTAELKGPALDWAVAQVEGLPAAVYPAPPHYVYIDAAGNGCGPYHPSHNWCQGGPLIEKYTIVLAFFPSDDEEFWANCAGLRTMVDAIGSTHLIAACRAIVASHLGDTVQIPEELT